MYIAREDGTGSFENAVRLAIIWESLSQEVEHLRRDNQTLRNCMSQFETRLRTRKKFAAVVCSHYLDNLKSDNGSYYLVIFDVHRVCEFVLYTLCSTSACIEDSGSVADFIRRRSCDS